MEFSCIFFFSLDGTCGLNYEGYARRGKCEGSLLLGLTWLVLLDRVIRGCAGGATSSSLLTYSGTDVLGLRNSGEPSLPSLLNKVPKELLRSSKGSSGYHRCCKWTCSLGFLDSAKAALANWLPQVADPGASYEISIM